MLVTSKPSKAKDPAIEEGTYAGYLVWAVNLGEQEFKGKGAKSTGDFKPRILVACEIPELNKEEDGKMLPRLVFNEYGWSADEKSTLVKHALCINKDAVNVGKSVDVNGLLGRPIGITLTVNDKGYNNVSGLSKLRASQIQSIEPMASECWTLDVWNPKSDTAGIKVLGKHTISKIMSANNASEIVFEQDLIDRLNELEEAYKAREKVQEPEDAEPQAKSKPTKVNKKVADKAPEDEDGYY